jgi:hypothetical protein
LPRIRTLRRLPTEFGLEAAAGVAGTYRRRAFDLAQLHLRVGLQAAGESGLPISWEPGCTEGVMLVTEPDLYGRAFFSISAGESPSVEAGKSLLRVALKKLSRNDHAYIAGLPDEEGAMCRRSESGLYARTRSKPARTNSKPARSLVEVLRDLFRPRRPQVVQAEVVPFPAEVATRTDKQTDREGSRAA